jgi:imidazolonepropionase-like amidohydrolase
VIAGTDSPIIPYGHSYHLELQAYVQLGGMSEHEALRSATAVAAEALGAEEDLGTVEAGKLADLAVLSADIRQVPPGELRDLPISMTVVGGRVAYEGT